MSSWTPNDWVVFFGAVSLLSAGLFAGIVTVINAIKAVSTKVELLEVKVDGRLTQLLDRTASASRAEGVVAGRGEVSVPLVKID